MKRLLTGVALALAFVATPAAADNYEGLLLYLEGGYGIERTEGNGAFGRTSYGRAAIGLQWGHLYLELDHVSDVQLEDENGGRNTIWFGFRQEFRLF